MADTVSTLPAHTLLTVREVADLVRFSTNTVLRAIHGKQLAAFRIGQREWRVEQADFEEWVKRGMPTLPREEIAG